MRKLQVCILFLFPLIACAQTGFKPGFIIDKSGQKYEGLLKFEPGNDKQAGELVFKESKKGKKEVYGTNYLKAFKIESDSFTVLKNIVLPRNKKRPDDFAKVLLVGSGGILYQLEYIVAKSSGHASTEYVNMQENIRYFISANGKLSALTASNFTAVANVVADCPELKTKIAGKKIKFADLQKVVEQYQSCKSK
jgi:hypothetical protein